MLELAGDDVQTALIANADDYKDAESRAVSTREGARPADRNRAEPVEFDLRDYFSSAPGRVATDLRQFGVVWVRGGSAFLLRRALRQSGADQCLAGLIEEDTFVYGGYSAGVVVLCPSLRGLEVVDDPAVVPAGYDSTVLWDGLGLLSYTVVPHFSSPHPSTAAIDLAVNYMLENRVPFRTLVNGDVIVVDGASERLFR